MSSKSKSKKRKPSEGKEGKAKKARVIHCKECKRAAKPDEHSVVAVFMKDAKDAQWMCPGCCLKRDAEKFGPSAVLAGIEKVAAENSKSGLLAKKYKGKCPHGNSPEDNPDKDPDDFENGLCDDPHRLCRTCYHEQCLTCKICGQIKRSGVGGGKNFECTDCIGKKLEAKGIKMVRCDHCKKEAELAHCEVFNGEYICRVCARERMTCNHCGNTFIDRSRTEKYCSEICFKMANPGKKCAQCEKEDVELKESDLGDLFFCDMACEKEYRDTHTTPKKAIRKARANSPTPCTVCGKRLALHEVFVDSQQFGKPFCSATCADKRFEKEVVPALEKRKKRMGINKEMCGACGLEFQGKELHNYRDKYGKARLCTNCMESDDDDETDLTKEKHNPERPKNHQAGYRECIEIEKRADKWKFHLRSMEGDNFEHIPGAGKTEGWKETMPMQNEVVVPAERGPATVEALKQMGYTFSDKPQEEKRKEIWKCLFCASKTDGKLIIDGEAFCTMRHAIWAGFAKEPEAAKAHTVRCCVCDEFTTRPMAIPAAPGQDFCSSGCIDAWTGF
jgi:hypothetical protein